MKYKESVPFCQPLKIITPSNGFNAKKLSKDIIPQSSFYIKSEIGGANKKAFNISQRSNFQI